MSPVDAGKGSTLGFSRTALIADAPNGVWRACREVRGKPAGASSALHDRDRRHDRLVELLDLHHVFTSFQELGSPSQHVDGFRMAELVELGVEVDRGVLPVHGQEAEPRPLGAAVDRRTGVMALLVAAADAGPLALV